MAELHAQIVSRKKAKELGMKFYFTGKPCKQGGIGYRRSGGGSCVCLKCISNRSEYSTNWRKENPDKRAAQSRRWQQENPGKIKDVKRKWYEENRGHVRDRARQWRHENPDKSSECSRKWRKKNPDKCRAFVSEYRAAKIHRTISHEKELTQLVMEEAAQQASDMADMFGIGFHVDHMIPMQGEEVSGLHVWYNLQILPAALNRAKGNRLIYTEPLEWLADCT